MKFLIYNYSNPWNTESYYFNAGLNLIEGVTSSLFNDQYSVYDNLDKTNPDILILHLSQISKDLFHYLTNNKKIKLVMNINGVQEEAIEKFNSLANLEKIDVSFFGWDEIKLNNIKYFKIPAGADIFLNISDQKGYSINKLIFVNSKDKIIDLDGTYHYTTINQEISSDVDFFLPITVLYNIFPNYDEIIFTDSSYIGSQLSFNAIYSGTKVTFDTKESKDIDKIDSIFKGQKLLSSVKNKHTCNNRLKSLLSQLSLSNLSEKINI